MLLPFANAVARGCCHAGPRARHDLRGLHALHVHRHHRHQTPRRHHPRLTVRTAPWCLVLCPAWPFVQHACAYITLPHYAFTPLLHLMTSATPCDCTHVLSVCPALAPMQPFSLVLILLLSRRCLKIHCTGCGCSSKCRPLWGIHYYNMKWMEHIRIAVVHNETLACQYVTPVLLRRLD